MPEEKRKNLPEADRGSYYNREESLDKFLDNKGQFYNDTEAASGGVL